MQRKMIKFLSVLLLICTICVVFGMMRPTEVHAASTVTLNGDFNGWSGWTMSKSGDIFTYTGTLSAGTYKFKIIEDGTWMGNDGSMDKNTGGSNVGWEFFSWAGDCTLVASASKYTFIYNASTNYLFVCNNHSMSSKVTKAATCTSTGVKTYSCATCHYSYTETIAKLGHNYAAATCTKPQTCTRCSATTGSALGHSYSYKATKNPTTSATGTLTGTCSRCKGTTTVTVPKLTTSNYTRTVKTAATCTTAGTYSWKWNTTTYGTFTFTSSIDKIAHSYSAATCTKAPTCSCGATSGSALGHSYSYAKNVNPTTSASGSIKGTCSRCSGTTTVTVPKLTTTDYTRTTTKAATCTATGTYTWTWKTTTYGTFSYTSSIAKIAHSYSAATCTKAPTCSCGATSGSALGHSYTYKVTKNPTTSASGTLVGTCSRCSASTGNITIGKLGTTYHTYKVTKAATCTATGTGRYTWGITDYGTYYWDVTIPATGHSYSYAKGTNPTTSATGTLTGTCSRCSGTTTVTVPKLNTTDYTRTTTTAATCTSTGTYKWTWNTTTYGNFSWNTTISKKDHSYAAATCTKPKTCTACGATSGSANGHSYSSKVTTAATCTSAGVRTYTCSACSDKYTESISATGHSYSGGKCGNCGDTRPVQIAGSFNGWATQNLTYSSSGYTFSVTLSAGDYEFKVVKDSVWLGNNGTIEDTTTATSSVGWEFVDGYNNCVLKATGGTYNFTFKYDTNMLIITFNHTHDYNIKGKVVAPTCTAKGYTVYSCACGGTQNRDETAATGHSYTSSVTKAATCTADGVRTYTCSKCSDKYTEAITKLGHDYKATVTAPTCTAQGYTTHKCSRCSDSYKDTYKDALGHSYSYAKNVNPTTSAAGSIKGTCSTCGNTKTVDLPKLNTTDYTRTVSKEATCTETGTYKWTWNTKTYGTFAYTSTIAAKGHSYTSKVTAPTCTAKGYTTYTCSCGDTYKDNYTNATGHSYTSSVTTAATCTADGVRTYTCSKCSDKYTEAITKLGHDYKATVTAPTCTSKGYTTHTCSRCSDSYKDTYKDALGHSYTSKVTTAATCTSDGVKTFTCGNCGDKYTESISATGHNYVGGKCGNCGDTKVVSVNGSFNDWAGQNMTYSANGYTFSVKLSAGTYQFKLIKDTVWMGNNGTIEDTTTKTSDIGWEFADWGGDCTLIATGGTYHFTFIYDTNMLVITYDHIHEHKAGDVVAPTCTTKGYTVYTCPCGDSYHGDEKAATGHSYTSKVTTAATCTKDGVKTFTCGNCGDKYTEVIAKLGHDYKTVVTAPTCTTKGYTTHTCSRCSDSYKDSYKDALGHNYQNGACTNCGDSCVHSYTSKVTKEPTCTADGVRTYTCSICSGSYTEAIDKLGHSYSSKVTAPTCTDKGYTT